MLKFNNNLIYYVILNKKDIVIDNPYNFNFVPNSLKIVSSRLLGIKEKYILFRTSSSPR